MKSFGVSVLLVVVGAALMFLASPSSGTSTFSDAEFASQDTGIVTANRKLKENNYNTHTMKMKRDDRNMNLEDYHLIDPSPSSKATIKTGPIEHGTPLMPYIPKPGPPPIQPSSAESP